MKIAIFQPPYPASQSPSEVTKCLEWMEESLQQLHDPGIDLIILPEYSNAPGINEADLLQNFSQERGSQLLDKLPAIAKRLQCCVAVGAIVKSGVSWFNRTIFLDQQGIQVAAYDKIHLTAFESDVLGLSCGGEITTVANNGITFGFAMCFDQYFPEHVICLRGQKVDVILCPSYQRSECGEQIVRLSQMRAIDSGAFFVRSGYSMGNENTGGHSLVASPNGSMLCDAGSLPGVTICEIDLQKKFFKPASHQQPPIEYRYLIERHQRSDFYQVQHSERHAAMGKSAFPILCAHRGLSIACPENTLPAFAAAIAVDVHEIEFDVRLTRDGFAVVCHDESVDRTTNGSGKICDLDLVDIQKLDAGIKSGPLWRGVGIPKFEELVDFAAGRVVMNIHLKEIGAHGELIRYICDLLRERGLIQTAYLALDTETALEIAAGYAPNIQRACLANQDDPQRQIGLAERFACSRIQFGRNVEDENISRARELGMVCNLFWSDDSGEAATFIDRGIDVVLTNCAAALIKDGLPRRRN